MLATGDWLCRVPLGNRVFKKRFLWGFLVKCPRNTKFAKAPGAPQQPKDNGRGASLSQSIASDLSGVVSFCMGMYDWCVPANLVCLWNGGIVEVGVLDRLCTKNL